MLKTEFWKTLPSGSILKCTLLAFLKMQSLQNRGAKHIMICVLKKKHAFVQDNGGDRTHVK